MTRLLTFALSFLAPAAVYAGDQAPDRPDPGAQVLDFTMKRIDGTPQNLAEHRGKVAMIVNVASECGFTPQYEGLQTLHEKYRDEGFVVLGFPANNFKNQEPGTNEQIKEFCTSKFGVTFPMFAKISVKGEDRHPLYQRLTSQPEPIGGEIVWNFQKFLVDRSGRVVARFHPRVEPMDERIVSEIERLLAEPAPERSSSSSE